MRTGLELQLEQVKLRRLLDDVLVDGEHNLGCTSVEWLSRPKSESVKGGPGTSYAVKRRSREKYFSDGPKSNTAAPQLIRQISASLASLDNLSNSFKDPAAILHPSTHEKYHGFLVITDFRVLCIKYTFYNFQRQHSPTITRRHSNANELEPSVKRASLAGTLEIPDFKRPDRKKLRQCQSNGSQPNLVDYDTDAVHPNASQTLEVFLSVSIPAINTIQYGVFGSSAGCLSRRKSKFPIHYKKSLDTGTIYTHCFDRVTFRFDQNFAEQGTMKSSESETKMMQPGPFLNKIDALRLHVHGQMLKVDFSCIEGLVARYAQSSFKARTVKRTYSSDSLDGLVDQDGIPIPKSASIFEKSCYNLELSRSGLRFTWRICEINQIFQLSRFMPPLLLAPQSLADAELKALASHTVGRRLPQLGWRRPGTGVLVKGCVLKRESQKSVKYRRLLANAYDKIVDSCSGGRGNHIAVKTIDLSVVLPSYETVRTTLEKLKRTCLERPQNTVDTTNASNYYDFDSLTSNSKTFISQLERTNWLQLIHLVLKQVMLIVLDITQGMMVILEEPTDRPSWTPFLSSLMQLVLDSETRSLQAFCDLIEHEWVLCGHPFFQFTSHLELARKVDRDADAKTSKAWSTNNASPETCVSSTVGVFPLFLDCVYQLWSQFPQHFEFTELDIANCYHYIWNPFCTTFSASSAESYYEAMRKTSGLTTEYRKDGSISSKSNSASEYESLYKCLVYARANENVGYLLSPNNMISRPSNSLKDSRTLFGSRDRLNACAPIHRSTDDIYRVSVKAAHRVISFMKITEHDITGQGFSTDEILKVHSGSESIVYLKNRFRRLLGLPAFRPTLPIDRKPLVIDSSTIPMTCSTLGLILPDVSLKCIKFWQGFYLKQTEYNSMFSSK